MGKYIPNKVVRKGEITSLTLLKTTKETRDSRARRINGALNRLQRNNAYSPYFAFACGNCWHVYEVSPRSDHPKLLHTKLPAASAHMWLMHRGRIGQ